MWTLQDAKNRLSAVVDAAMEGEPQRVTRRGKPTVEVLADAEFERLRSGAPARPLTFKEHLLAFPQGGPDDLDFDAERSAFRARPIDL